MLSEVRPNQPIDVIEYNGQISQLQALEDPFLPLNSTFKKKVFRLQSYGFRPAPE